jgi:hypothetical protein
MFPLLLLSLSLSLVSLRVSRIPPRPTVSLSRCSRESGSLGALFLSSSLSGSCCVCGCWRCKCEQESMSLRADQYMTANHTLCCVVICTWTWTFLSFWIVVFCYVLSVCLRAIVTTLLCCSKVCVCVFSADATFVLFSLCLFVLVFCFVSLFRLLILLVVCILV